jgi:hypothetical protein
MLQFWNILYCRWKKTSDNRKFVERHDIRSLKVKYLRAITAYREEGRPIVYADEPIIHSSHTTYYAWDDRSGAGLKAPVSKGRHLFIVHADNNCLILLLNSQPTMSLDSLSYVFITVSSAG